MREIKFRVWVNNGMIYPTDIYGDVENEYLIALNGLVFYFKEDSNGNYCPPSLSAKGVGNLELMQYTGLKDKNGKEIYYKDIVQDDDGKIRTIEWNNQNAQFYMKTENRYKEFIDCGQSQSDSPVHCDTIEIIGNIYEHPHLLTNKLNKTLSGDKK